MMTRQEILELLQQAGQETVFSFVADYAADDTHFCEKLKKALQLDEDEDLEFDMDYYREMAEDCFDFGYDFGHRRSYDYDFRVAASRAAIDLNEILKEADSYVQRRGFSGAAGRAMAVIEAIPLNSDNVDDYDGDLSETFQRALTLLCDTLNNTSVADALKKEIYDWCKGEVTKGGYLDYGHNGIQPIYDLCCQILGNTEEVLADLDRQINESTDDHGKCKK